LGGKRWYYFLYVIAIRSFSGEATPAPQPQAVLTSCYKNMGKNGSSSKNKTHPPQASRYTQIYAIQA